MANKRTNRTTTRNRSAGDWAPQFLSKLALCGNIREAAQAAKVSRSNVYERRDNDPEFAQAMKHAMEDALDRLEAAGWKRASRKSDKLLQYLLTVHRYKNVLKLEHTGEDGGPVEVVEVVVRNRAEADQILANQSAPGGVPG